MTTTKITCPHCAHQYQRTYPRPYVCPACGMYLHGCYNRADVSRDDYLWVQDGSYIAAIVERDGSKFVMDRYVSIDNAFRDQECQINLPACGDCRWRKHD